ncbi:MAG: hypothetical protein GXY86_15100 [Firmicutes bacterium]|nr:hypothetical protein [Bacillota bacterium]
MEYVNLQLNSFLILFLTGIFWGGFFDLYRVLRSTIKVNPVIDNLGDLFFWLISLLLIGPMVFWSTWLELRFYVWLALGMGLVAYFSIFSAKLIRAYLRFWKAITWAPRLIGKLTQHLKLVLTKTAFSYRVKKKKPGGPKPPGVREL